MIAGYWYQRKGANMEEKQVKKILGHSQIDTNMRMAWKDKWKQNICLTQKRLDANLVLGGATDRRLAL